MLIFKADAHADIGVNVQQVSLFYLALDMILGLNVGKIVLAASSSYQLQAILDQELPYLDPFMQETEECINGSAECQLVIDLVKSLGIQLQGGTTCGLSMKPVGILNTNGTHTPSPPPIPWMKKGPKTPFTLEATGSVGESRHFEKMS